MRSLQEWLDYVETQAEAARQKRQSKNVVEEKSSENATDAPAQESEGSVAVAVAIPSEEMSEIAPPEAVNVGRALLNFGTTSPLPPRLDSNEPPMVRNSLSLDNRQRPKIVKDRFAPRQKADDDPEEANLEEDSEENSPESPTSRWHSTALPPRLQNLNSEASAASPAPNSIEESLSTETEAEVLPAPEVELSLSEKVPVSAAVEFSLSEKVSSPESLVEEASSPAVSATAETESPEIAQDLTISELSNEAILEQSEAEAASPDVAEPRKRTRRLTEKKAKVASLTEEETAEEAQALWDRVPRHVQALVRTQNDEVAQRSYQSFKETRQAMIHRLLDPELSLEEAARILGVCPTTVRRYTNRGVLTHHRTPGNQRRFRLSNVLEFMERFGKALVMEAHPSDAPGDSNETSYSSLALNAEKESLSPPS